MPRTRLSLFYVVGYLVPTGLALMFAPTPILKALLSNADYGEIMPSFVGVMMLGLGISIAALIYYRVERMYPGTLVVRGIIVAWLFVLYFKSGDPLFLMIVGVVALGMAVTSTCLLLDRRA